MKAITIATMVALSATVIAAQNSNTHPVTAVPITADITIERVTQLIDGNKLTHSTLGKFYRDEARRTRIEFGTQVTIFDPVANTATTMDLSQRTAQVTNMAAAPTRRSTEPATDEDNSPPPGGLESQMIEGYLASGKEYKSVIPPGSALGNELPIERTTRLWYSDELTLPLLTEIDDPLVGYITTRYQNLVAGTNPDDDVFAVPSDFNITYDEWAPSGPVPSTFTNPHAVQP